MVEALSRNFVSWQEETAIKIHMVMTPDLRWSFQGFVRLILACNMTEQSLQAFLHHNGLIHVELPLAPTEDRSVVPFSCSDRGFEELHYGVAYVEIGSKLTEVSQILKPGKQCKLD